jgi:hypothetical protein
MRTFASVVLWFLAVACGARTFCDSASAEPASADAPLARIDTGSLSGITAAGVASFKGIPYAAPPVGALRWRMPQPPRPWTAVKADKFGPSCRQIEDIPKSEDCLTLNVWRPATAITAPLPASAVEPCRCRKDCYGLCSQAGRDRRRRAGADGFACHTGRHAPRKRLRKR